VPDANQEAIYFIASTTFDVIIGDVGGESGFICVIKYDCS
jgi:hypothetical protein